MGPTPCLLAHNCCVLPSMMSPCTFSRTRHPTHGKFDAERERHCRLRTNEAALNSSVALALLSSRPPCPPCLIPLGVAAATQDLSPLVHWMIMWSSEFVTSATAHGNRWCPEAPSKIYIRTRTPLGSIQPSALSVRGTQASEVRKQARKQASERASKAATHKPALTFAATEALPDRLSRPLLVHLLLLATLTVEVALLAEGRRRRRAKGLLLLPWLLRHGCG